MFFTKKTEPVADAAEEKAPAAFPDIGLPEDLVDVNGATGSGDVTIEALSTRFDDYKAESEARETRLLDALVNSRGAPAVVAEGHRDEPKAFVPAEIPDSVEDPEGFARVVQENAAGSVQHMLDAQAAESAVNASNTTAQTGMWDEFKDKYADLAAHEELVEVHANRVAKTLRDQGIDVPTYMTQNRDKFLTDVANSVGARLVALGLGPKSPDGERPDPQANRTGGLPGSGSSPIVPVPEPAQEGTFVGDIHKMQKSMGLI